MERQEYNRRIISKLAELIEKHPHLRFHQLLFCCDLLRTSCNNSKGIPWMEDPFYVESETAWERMVNNKFVFNELDN